jgi:hypothetical protein
MNRLWPLAILVLVLTAGASAEEHVSLVTIKTMTFLGSGGTTVAFGVAPVAPHTCSFWGVQFRLDITTIQGRNMYALLLAAKTMGTQIDVWYEDSPTPGTNETNGCTPANLSSVDDLGFE